MSASLCRCLRSSGRNWLRLTSNLGNKHRRTYCANEYNDNSVPYFPDQHRMKSLEADYPEVEVSAEDFKYVERLIPPATVPSVPEHESFPTPSGWVPPRPEIQPETYTISRSRYHQLPVYLEQFFSGRITTKLSHVNGDVWRDPIDKQCRSGSEGSFRSLQALIWVYAVCKGLIYLVLALLKNCNEDLKEFLKQQGHTEPRIQVHEVGRFIRLKGNYVELVGKFLLEKGF